MKALVYKSTGSWYQVKDEAGTLYNARIVGRLKTDGITSTNPVAVGDWVDLETGSDPESGNEQDTMITSVHTRRNYINRVSPHNTNQHHIVAANLDQSLLFATLKDPKTSLGFIDRFLVISEAYRVPATVVFNKADVYRKKEMDKFEWVQELYTNIGYKVVLTSIEKGTGLQQLEEILHDKTTLLSGHSGVGKSSFINHLFPSMQLKTKKVSEWSGKGMHTTTFAEMFDLPGGGKIIDTPGIREMGLVDISKEELSHYYPEMRALINDCQFNDCNHIEEPGCAVKKAVEEERIHEERYISYLSIRDSILHKGY